jgi:transposase
LWRLVAVPFIMGKYQADRFGWSKGQCDLVLRDDGKWFLLVTVDIPDGTPIDTEEFIGVDLGVINIATDSDGEKATSADIEAKRAQYAARRGRLGKATKGADRNRRRHCHKAIERTRKKEARFRRDTNHRISKRLTKLGRKAPAFRRGDIRPVSPGAPGLIDTLLIR